MLGQFSRRLLDFSLRSQNQNSFDAPVLFITFRRVTKQLRNTLGLLLIFLSNLGDQLAFNFGDETPPLATAHLGIFLKGGFVRFSVIRNAGV